MEDLLLESKIKAYRLEQLIAPRHYTAVTLKTIAKGEHIFQQSESVDYLYFLLKGKVRVYQLLNNGKRNILGIIDNCCVLGEIELIYDRGALNSIDLLEDCEFLVIPIKYCRDEMLKDNVFLRCITYHLAQTLYSFERNMSNMTSFTLENKITSYILSIETDHRFVLELNILPDFFSITYRHFLRIIKKLCDDNIIERQSSHFYIKDRQALVAKTAGCEMNMKTEFIQRWD